MTSEDCFARFVGYVERVAGASSDYDRAAIVGEYRAAVMAARGDQAADIAAKELRGFAWAVIRGNRKIPVVKSTHNKAPH